MLNFALIFLCLLVGVVLRKLNRFQPSAPHALNTFIINISLPAVVLTQLPPLLATQRLSMTMLIPVSMPWILFALSFVFFRWVGERRQWSQGLVGALTLTAGLGNTSFVGFPLLAALLGEEAISVGVLLDQLGTFLVLSTLGLLAAAGLATKADRAPSVIQTFKRVGTFPPFQALLASLLWVAIGFAPANPASRVLEKIASTLVPLALVAVGLQLNLSWVLLRRRWKPLILGLSFKLVAAPLIFWFFYSVLLGIEGRDVHITLLEAAMAPMITAAVVANEFELDGEMANLMVGLGIPLSLVTVPLWHYLLSGVSAI